MYENNRRNNGRRQQKTLEEMFGKTVLVITKQGYWFVGWLKGISNRGVIITGVTRLEPEYEGDQPKIEESLHATIRTGYPFIVPVSNSENIYIRKLFIPWSNIQMIGRAKPESEIDDN